MKDFFHDIAKKALEKQNWEITHDPFFPKSIQHYDVKIIVFHPTKKEIVEWIE